MRSGLILVMLLMAGERSRALAAESPQPCQGRACTASDFWAGVGELHQLKTELVSALRAFAQSASGSYGDEGRLLSPQLDAVQRALESWDRAIAVFESAARPAATNADVRAALGAAYLDRSRIREALTELGAAAKVDPRRADVHTLLAMAHELAGDTPSAIAELEKAAAVAPGDLSMLYRVANALSETDSAKTRDAQRRVDAAHLAGPEREAIQFDRIGLLRQVAGVAPIFPPQRYVAGFRLFDSGRYPEGMAVLRQAIAADPLAASAPSSAAAVAGARLRQGQLQAALSVLRSAGAQPTDAETLRIAGVAYWADERYDTSIDVLTSASRMNPGDERSRIALADVLVAAGKSAEAEQVLKDAIALLPGSGQAHYRLGQLYQSESLVANAIGELEQAIASGPLVGLDYLYETLGGLYATQADFDHAAAAYRKRIDVNPNNPEAHRKLGEIYVLQGRDEAALSEFAVTERLDGTNVEAFAEAGQAYVRAGRFADAVRSSRAALALDPKHQKARFVLGTALTRLGDSSGGQRELDVFQREVEDTAAARRRALEVRTLERDAARAETTGEYAQGVLLLARALDAAPGDARLEFALGRMLVKAGRPGDALEHLAKASQSGDRADIHQAAADAYAALGQEDARDREDTRVRQLVEQRKEERLRTRPLLR